MCPHEGPPASIRWSHCVTSEEAVFSFQFSVLVLAPLFLVLRLFLFKETAESTDGIGGILPLRQRLGGAGGGSAGAAKLRREQAGGETANIGNEFRIGSCAMNQEW